MQIVLHAGAHKTDENRIVKCLQRNTEEFTRIGVSVPAPSTYRWLIRDTLQAINRGDPLAPDARSTLLTAMHDGPQPDRMILANDNFFCVPKLAVARGVFYPNAEERLAGFRDLFEKDETELFLAIRNPATFLPALYEESPNMPFEEFLDGTDPAELRWSELVARIKTALPDLPITVWCNEDTPLIWGQIIRDMAGLDPNRKIVGGFDLLSEIMSKEGMKRFRAYLKTHPVMTEMQKRRVIAAFLDKFAIEDEIEEVVDLPGWTEVLMDNLTDLYDEDVFQISRMPGVNLITP